MGEKKQPITYIIPHTHWDREWYVPFQYFRFRLVEMIDKLIELMEKEPEFKFFNFDGQTILIDDYLTIKPEMKPRLTKLIQNRRIGIGPWFLQSDPWLQTGEGIIRNLLKGFKSCQEYGVRPINVGWVPDQFIHPPQFPQIYRGFGLDYAAFGRGMANQYDENPKLTCEFKWEGIDGTSVSAFNLRAGYGLCAHLDPNPIQAMNQIGMDIAKLNEIPWSTHIHLGFAGSDHCGPDHSLIDAIQMINEDEDITEEIGKLKIASWDDYLTDFLAENPQLETVKGELAGRRYSIALHGVFSSYMPLKQRSYKIHQELERLGEPYNAIGQYYEAPSLSGFLHEAWKFVLENQPHDSSWTSSVDQVQKDMEYRYDQADMICKDVFRRNAQWIMQHLKIPENSLPITVFNPHPWARSGWIQARFANKFEKSALQLVDMEGNEITAQIYPVEANDFDRDRRRVYVGSHGSLGSNFHEIKFAAENIPPLGYKTFFIKPRDPTTEFALPTEGLLDGNDYYLENDAVRIVVETDGTFTLMAKAKEEEDGDESGKIESSIWSKQSDYQYKQLHFFEDCADGGDGWEFCPIEGTDPIITTGKELQTKLIEASDYSGSLLVKRKISIPKSASLDYLKRSEQIIDLPITTYIGLEKGNSPLVKFQTKITNIATDHRIRLLFPTHMKTDKIIVNGHFGIHYRKISPPDGTAWVRPPETTFPFHKFIAIWDDEKKRGLALLTKGLPEYEAFHSKDGEVTLALTLYRSTGRWGRHIGVNPLVQTPRAQLINQEMIFDYAIMPLNQPWDDNSIPDHLKIYRIAEEYLTPLQWEEEYDTYRYKILEKERNLPLFNEFLKIEPANVVLSSLKTAETDPKRIIIRVYNILHKDSKCELKFNSKLKTVSFCDLKEEPLNIQPNFSLKEKILEFDMTSAKIATIKIEFV